MDVLCVTRLCERKRKYPVSLIRQYAGKHFATYFRYLIKTLLRLFLSKNHVYASVTGVAPSVCIGYLWNLHMTKVDKFKIQQDLNLIHNGEKNFVLEVFGIHPSWTIYFQAMSPWLPKRYVFDIGTSFEPSFFMWRILIKSCIKYWIRLPTSWSWPTFHVPLKSVRTSHLGL